jgi:hypothetical protein
MIEEPGTRFEYCRGGSHLLSVIVRQTTGMSALGFVSARGRGGQYIFVAPSLNLVVVPTGGGSRAGSEAKRQKLADSLLLRAVRSDRPLTPNPEGVALLESRIERAALPPEIETETRPLPVGLDGRDRIAPGRFGIPAAARGSWEEDDLFVLHMNEIGNINHWTIAVRFEGDAVGVSMKDVTGLGAAEIRGRLRE